MCYTGDMSYICKKKNREGTFYTFLCEGYRIDGKSRQRTLKYFGKTTDEEFQDLKRRHAKGEFDDLNKTKNIVKVSLDLDSEKVSNEAKNIGWKTLQEIYDELDITKAIKNYSKSHKFKYSLDEVMQLLVFCRVLYPDSKANTINEMQHKLFGNWDFSYNDIMRSLDHFYDLQEELQIVMHKSICENIGRSAYLVFY
ncbi:MAG: hypothetical protein LBQ41_03880, partial [Candidatus Ancillula sp.]|nr:hypothetical protein [Candidatus Ancillula sp.]